MAKRGGLKRVEERSAGVIVFYNDDGKRYYLLLKHRRGHWDLPKGNIEEGEDPYTTALREVFEETGLVNLKLYPGFERRIEYYYQRKGGILVHKVVIFYLAETHNAEVHLSDEHVGFRWLPYEEAVNEATFKNTKMLIRDAEKYLSGIK